MAKTVKNNPYKVRNSLSNGSIADLRLACKYVEDVADAIERTVSFQTIEAGFMFYRSRNEYLEDIAENSQMRLYPLKKENMGAPPACKTELGRFNRKGNPVLYLSTTREVALAECKARPIDTSTVGEFSLLKPAKIAIFLKTDGFPIGWLMNDEPSQNDYDQYLLHQITNFLCQPVSDSERYAHYRLTSLLASVFEEREFNGIAYRTSFWSPAWREEDDDPIRETLRSSNVVLFDPKIAEVKHVDLYSIDWKRPVSKREW